MPDVSVHPNTKEKGEVRFAWAQYEDVCVTAQDDLKQALTEQEQITRETMTVETIAGHPGVACSRRAFKVLGIDPARYRPSQEALLRRTLQEKSIPLINTGVDTNNLLSLKLAVPMGLYDADKISGAGQIKVGGQGETYEALNGRLIDGENKWIIRDREGPFGSPFVDSVRTAVGVHTRNLLHVIYFYYEGLPADALEQCRSAMERYLKGHCKGYHHL